MTSRRGSGGFWKRFTCSVGFVSSLAGTLLAAASGTSAQQAVLASLTKGQPSAISDQQSARGLSGSTSSQSSAISPNSSSVTRHATRAQLDRSYGRLPLSFERNDGQTDEQVKFVARGRGYTLFLTPTEAVLALRKAKVEAEVKGKSDEERSALSSEHSAVSGDSHQITRSPDQQISSVVRMKLEGANMSPSITGMEKLPGIVNYFIGNDPTKWRTNIPTYKKVEYKNVYPGIDLAYYGNQGKLEYDLIVAPGADPNQIKLAFGGADKIEVNEATGDLVLSLPASEAIGDRQGEIGSESSSPESPIAKSPSPIARATTLRLMKPLVYQLDGKGHKHLVAGNYVVLASVSLPSTMNHQPSIISFQVAAYDSTKPLIIDPVISFATYLGGTSDNLAGDVAVDSSGSVYVTGITTSVDFPITSGAFQPALNGFENVFVTKLSANGSSLLYSTYLGGGGDESRAIVVDSAGQAYVTGETFSSNFPTTSASYQPLHAGAEDAFVTKLAADGSALVYSTYIGTNFPDRARSIAIDQSGNAYVTGSTNSSNFSTTAGAFQTAFGGGSSDAFVIKLNPQGSAALFSTFLGGTSFDHGASIALDSSNNIIILGATGSDDFPTRNPVQALRAGDTDAFIIKMLNDGSDLTYSTFLGGSSLDIPLEIAVDAAGNVYVTGSTNSKNFPVTPGAFQTTFADDPSDAILDSEAFVTKLDPLGTTLVYSTFLGGIRTDFAAGIAVDTVGNAYLFGTTFSTDFPTSNPLQASSAGNGDVFVAKLNPTGSTLLFSTYLGGSGIDEKNATFGGRGGIALDQSANIYVSGQTESGNFPTTAGVIQPSLVGARNIFVAKISQASTVVSVAPNSGRVGDSVTISGSGFGTTQGTSTVTFNGVDAGAATSWSDTQIVINVPTGATTGPVVVTVNGIPSNTDQTFTILVPDFTLSASPGTQTVVQGQQATYTVTLGSVNGFTAAVDLSVTSGVPANTATFVPDPNPGPYPANSTLTISTGSLSQGTYSPIAIHGDGGGQMHDTSVELVVQANAQPPTASALLSFTTSENTATTITLSGNDPEGAPLTFTITMSPTKGTLGALSAPTCVGGTCTATVIYTPTGDLNGMDSFAYRVSDGVFISNNGTVEISITAAADAPVAVTDVTTVAQNSTANPIAVLSNDTDPDNLTPPFNAGVTITAVTGAGSPATCGTATTTGAGGTVSCSASGVTYTPPVGFTGTDSFTYRISDGSATATATVTIRVVAGAVAVSLDTRALAAPTFDIQQGATTQASLGTALVHDLALVPSPTAYTLHAPAGCSAGTCTATLDFKVNAQCDLSLP